MVYCLFNMAVLKLFICVAFLSVVLSEEHNAYQQLVENKLKNIQLNSTDLAKIFPSQQVQLSALLKELDSSTDKEKVAILNDYADDVLENLNTFLILNGADPIQLEDMITGFEFKFLFVTYWAEIGLKNGWLQGVASMERRGDVTLVYEKPYLRIHGPLGLNKLVFTYDYKITFMGLGPRGGVDGTVDGTKFTFDLTINLSNLRADLENFKLNTIGKVDLKFNGYIWLDWFVNLCVKFALIGVKPILQIVIQAFTSGILNQICDVYNGIICQLLGDCPGELVNLVL